MKFKDNIFKEVLIRRVGQTMILLKIQCKHPHHLYTKIVYIYNDVRKNLMDRGEYIN